MSRFIEAIQQLQGDGYAEKRWSALFAVGGLREMAERLFGSVRMQETESQSDASLGISGVQLQHQLENFRGGIPASGFLQAESQVVVRFGVVRFRTNHREVAERRVLEAAERKLDLTAQGGVVRGQFPAAADQHVQRFGKLAGRAQRHN